MVRQFEDKMTVTSVQFCLEDLMALLTFAHVKAVDIENDDSLGIGYRSKSAVGRFYIVTREVATTFMGGNYVCIPCAGGGSVSSETGWDGRKKDEEDEGFRLRCWLHAAKTVKASRNIPTRRKGFGVK